MEKRGSGNDSFRSNGIHPYDEIDDVAEELKHLPPSLSKRHQGSRLDMKKSTVTDALKFINNNNRAITWEKAEKKFEEFSKENSGLLIKRSHFGECIGLIQVKTEETNSGRMKYEIDDDSKNFAERLFDSLCRRRNITGESIDKEHFKEFWKQIADVSLESRLKTFFDIVDKDGDGMISKEEITEIIKQSAPDNMLKFEEDDLNTYAELFMEKLDNTGCGYITIESLEMLLSKEAKNNVGGGSETLEKTHIRWYKDLKYFLHRNWRRCWVVALWIVTMVGLFTWKYIDYKNRVVYDVLGSCVCIAKGAAETLKLNMAIILLPVCRNTVTWLRNKTKLSGVVPFDDNISFHQVIVVAIAIGIGLHAISHLACDFPRLIHATEEEYKPMQQFFGDQAKNYWHFMKEVEGYTGIIMIVLMSVAFTLATPWLRRGKPNLPQLLKKLTGFNAFWYSHHLFVIVYVMLIVHGIKLYLTKEWYKKTTWMYLMVPILLYACERLIRTFRSRLIPASLHKVVAYPGDVVALHMTKPKDFKYNSGQYVFVKYHDVSHFEWHPFSITSAPGDNYLSVHIKALGDWTREINQKLRDSEKYKLEKEGRNEIINFERVQNIPKVKIDGPYGAPAQDYKKYEVVLLVGTGIGATPMISIVKDIVNNMKANEEKENALEDGTNTITLQKNKVGALQYDFGTKRAYFYCVDRKPESFGWFEGVMKEVAKKDTNDVIEMHNYCTSVYNKDDVRFPIFTTLQSLYLAKKGVDVISGTRVRSGFGKPNWSEVYKRIADQHKDSKIGVFYCGNATGVPKQKQLALYFSKNTSTRFVFHKENF